jgi:hypothetical protein
MANVYDKLSRMTLLPVNNAPQRAKLTAHDFWTLAVGGAFDGFAKAADDLGRKVRLYGSHNVPEYWVVDRDSKRIIQMWEPSEDGYAQRLEIVFGRPVYAATLTGVVVETGELA